MTEETSLKCAVKDYLKARGIFNYHLMAGMGSYRGSPDRIMHYRGRVIYLEIKKKKGILSEHQMEFQRQCKADKVEYWVIRNIDELIKKLN